MSMPAEWHPQSAIYLAWPCSDKIWSHSRPQILEDFAKLISAISDFTKVKLLCEKSFQEQAKHHIGSLNNIELIDLATDDVWCRDFGPIFVKNPKKEVHIINWDFNAWGGKFADYAKDNAIAKQIATINAIDCISPDFILEGGAIEVNGQGLAISTESVIYNTNRNPAQSRPALIDAIKEHFGVSEIIMLEGGLVNDDTDGHIDNITRFFKEDGVLTCTCDDRNPNFETLQKNLKQLQNFESAHEKYLEIVELPLPDPIYLNGEILPASYANFLISNQAVFIPEFGQTRKDLEAQEILQQCFPDKKIIPIDCRLFVIEGGGIHCLSQQEITL
ncbi:agmatine deiminase family protein [Lentisphaera profundi]|uniref:Agmatine deiminase family protein n=1 Tax=Lentisphaera profundi TaxID=1658616 RepID=A0ABY7W0Y7_9BACT|nr:agmatine deiminase family protein [Lentisphaera profundi]WDE98696.1 agmatine deiminase family protein [Lentisphaera profundi]